MRIARHTSLIVSSLIALLGCASKPGAGTSTAGAGGGGSPAGSSSTSGSTSSAATTSSGSPPPGDAGTCGLGATRDPVAQPFSSDSVWNMPIGSGAEYVAAGIAPATGWGGLSTDEDVLVLTPAATATSVYYQSSWAPPRCTMGSSQVFFSLPMPSSFVIDDTGGTPNACLAGILSDGRTIVSGQPFARCTAGGYATLTYPTANVDLYGQGITGSHGGSGLSAYGGTLRVGELRPGGCPPRHALKLELDGTVNYYGTTATNCFAWPATNCDADGPGRYSGTNAYLKPGALLALAPSVSMASLGLETEAGAQLAWTLQNYGAYVVDDTGWSVYQNRDRARTGGRIHRSIRVGLGPHHDSRAGGPDGSEPGLPVEPRRESHRRPPLHRDQQRAQQRRRRRHAREPPAPEKSLPERARVGSCAAKTPRARGPAPRCAARGCGSRTGPGSGWPRRRGAPSPRSRAAACRRPTRAGRPGWRSPRALP